VLIPAILWLSHRFEWYDEMNSRKIHTEDTPRLGGVGIFLSFVILAGVILFSRLEAAQAARYLPLLIGVVIIHFLGLLDDFINLIAPRKFFLQVLAALVVSLGPFRIDQLALPFVEGAISLGWLAYPITIIWIVSISNAVNLIDGADGLAGGVAAIAALFIGTIAAHAGSITLGLLAFALVGAVVGFLVYNFPPARIFMGDSGSLLLGFLLATLPLLGLDTGAGFPAMPVITLLFLPILDTLMAISRRISRGLPVHQADREHIHHRLIDRGFGPRRLLLTIYAASAVLGLTALSWFILPAPYNGLLDLAVWIAAIWISVALGKRPRRHLV
jgi:UDP-GlcNAc:undecaprenyl-phosphate GlcNAc-1-phosphate transferase